MSSLASKKTGFWTDITLLLVLSSCLVFPFLGSAGIIDTSEGYYAEGSREMFESGNYLVPHLNYVPWFEKPILTYWLMCFAYKIFGVSEFAARFPSALLSVMLICSTYCFARMVLTRKSALLSALMLCAFPLFLVMGHLCLTDMPFAAMLSMSGLALAAFSAGASSWVLLIAYAFLGLALLAKGPVALFLLGGTTFVYLIWTSSDVKDFFKRFWSYKPFLGLIFALVIALPWYVLVNAHTNGQFFQEFFVKQNVGRMSGSLVSHHDMAFWYYLPVIFVGCLPWTLFGLSSIAFAQHWSKWFKPGSAKTKSESFTKYCFVWFVLTVLFFTVVPAKLATYILPALPPLAVVLANFLMVSVRLKKNILLWTGPVLTVAGLVFLLFLPKLTKSIPQDQALLWSLSILTIVCFMAYTVAGFKSKKVLSVRIIFASIFIGCAMFIPIAIKSYFDSHQKGFYDFTKKYAASDVNLAILGPRAWSAAFNMKRKIYAVDKIEEAPEFLKTNGRHHIAVIEHRLKHLEWFGQTKEIGRGGKWYFYEVVTPANK